jgi:hypothetical protein
MHVYAVALPVKTQFYALMDQPLAAHPLAYSRGIQQINGPLLEHTRTNALLHILASLRLDYDGFDAFQVEQMREQKTGGSRANNANFCV